MAALIHKLYALMDCGHSTSIRACAFGLDVRRGRCPADAGRMQKWHQAWLAAYVPQTYIGRLLGFCARREETVRGLA